MPSLKKYGTSAPLIYARLLSLNTEVFIPLFNFKCKASGVRVDAENNYKGK
jgi:hypothetical protein